MSSPHSVVFNLVSALPRRRRGFSLIELSIVLALISLMLGGVMLFFHDAEAHKNASDCLIQFAEIKSAIQQDLANNVESGFLQKDILNYPEIERKWVNGTALVTPFGTPLSLFYYVNKDAGVQEIVYQLDGLDAKTCSLVGTSLNSEGIVVNNLWGDETQADGNQSFSPLWLAKACATMPEGGQIRIVVPLNH